MSRSIVVLIALALVAAGCSKSSEADGKVEVVAGFYPIADLAERIAGDAAEVSNLTPAGAEPHDFELSPGDVGSIRDADVVLYLGDGFSPAVEDAAKQSDGEALDLLDGLELDHQEEGHSHEGEAHDSSAHGESEHSDELDPHVWLDPVLMTEMSRKVEAALQAAVPDKSKEISQRAENYRTELQVLDNEYRTRLSSCERDVIVTAHAAFHYPTKRYGFEQHAIVLSPDGEPTSGQLDELIDVVRDERVPVIFSETLVSTRVADTLAREAGVRVETLDPIEGLADDQAAEGKSYFSLMRENLAAIRSALGCS